jgi:NhaP-type Na+/H+ or K+/H+ antiporter
MSSVSETATDVPHDIPSDYEIVIIVLICLSYTLATLLIARYCTSISLIGSNVPWFHQSSVAALIGLLIGGIMSNFNITILFNDSIFFYVVLPPIIFTAGYTLKKKKFFTYLHQIVLYGLVGSVVNFIFITFAAYHYQSITLSWNQALLLSSVLAANDEISAISLIKQSEFPRLGALLFGEGVLNDALSIVLFQALLSNSRKATGSNSNTDAQDSLINLAAPLISSVMYQLSISCIIGLSCGLCNARVLKVFTFSRKHPVHQTTLIMLTGYLAYTIAEALDVSSILTLFVSAVTMSHYSWHSLSKSAKLASRITFVSMSDAAEGFAFAYVGLSLWVVVSTLAS